MFKTVRYGWIIFFLLIGFQAFSQVSPPRQPASDTLREFEVIRAPSMRAIQIDSATTLQTVAGGGVIIKQGGTIFHCDSASVNPVTHILEAFGNIVINQGDTVHTYGEYLKYLGVEKIAHIERNVKLISKSGTLYTKTLDYNLQTGIGNFTNGGKVIDGKNIITSVEGTYYDDTKDIYFKKDVKLDGPKNHVRADSLLYNMQTRKSTFISPTNIKNNEVEINTTEGTYDLTTGNALFTSRTTVKDSSNRLYSANSMALEDSTGNAQLEGNAVIIDSAGGYTIIANQIFLNKKNNSFLATRKPVLILKREHDSTYISADTIFSGFTTFVKNENRVLQKDSLINVNIKENEKVRQTILNDTAPIPSLVRNVDKVDTFRKEFLANERLKIFPPGMEPAKPAKEPEKENIGPPEKKVSKNKTLPKKNNVDSLHRKEPSPLGEHKAESGIVSDSLQMKNELNNTKMEDSLLQKDSLLQRDSLQKEFLSKEQKVDSSEIDSIVKINDKVLAVGAKNGKHLNKKNAVNKSDTAIRYFLAFHHVRIFNDSLQSICDSMFISSKDSVFRLYYAPVVWSGSTQINGDTIFLYTENKKPKRLYVFESGLIVNKTREGFFNQMSGKTINGYFIDGKIDYMRIKGTQSESIYYMQDDDSAYIGMNRATGDVIDLYFKNEDLNRVLFINEVQGKMYPMDKIPEDQKELKIFQWLDNKRPKNKAEIFE
ncbi:MAG: OstA-like protein [Ginsengibacter sp.]